MTFRPQARRVVLAAVLIVAASRVAWVFVSQPVWLTATVVRLDLYAGTDRVMRVEARGRGLHRLDRLEIEARPASGVRVMGVDRIDVVPRSGIANFVVAVAPGARERSVTLRGTAAGRDYAHVVRLPEPGSSSP